MGYGQFMFMAWAPPPGLKMGQIFTAYCLLPTADCPLPAADYFHDHF